MVTGADRESAQSFAKNQISFHEYAQTFGEHLGTYLRQPVAHATEGLWPMHQLPQDKCGPAARDGGESDLDGAVGFGLTGASALVLNQLDVPVGAPTGRVHRRHRGVGFRLVTHVAARFAGVMSIESNLGSHHAPTVSLTTDPKQLSAVFAEAFNSGSADSVGRVYEHDAVFVPHPGRHVAGEHLAEATAEFLRLGRPITVHPRHTYVADDIALLIVDWVIDGPGLAGEQVHIEGTATDVARRGADGLWRYIIDNPFGTAKVDAQSDPDSRDR